MFLNNPRASAKPEVWPEGRSTCVTSPVITTLEFEPKRVRNIFICVTVVFWASSKITKLSSSVRPRMNASGATSITPRWISAMARGAGSMSCIASYSGRRYGSIFSVRSPGKNPSFSPASTAGRVSTKRFTRWALSA